MRNIGISFVKLGQYQDAITSFETIAESNTDYQAGKLFFFRNWRTDSW